jgi:integrase
MRIGDAVSIDMEDLNLNQCLEEGTAYREILIFDQKTGSRRNVWISEEAVEAIGEWLKVRQDYLTQASEKCTPRRKKSGGVMFPYGKARDDSRLFPFSTINARAIWNNAIKSAEMDDRDRFINIRKLHPHSLRKFYRTKRAGV